MEKDINKISRKDLILWKMRNMLESSARLCIENSTLTDKQKIEEMQTIEQLVNFIKDYDSNIRILEQYNKPLSVQEMNRIEREDLGYR